MNAQTFIFRTFAEKYLQPEKTELENLLTFFPPLSSEGPWICGGSVRRTIDKEPLDSDFDFFFAGIEQRDKFLDSIQSAGKIKILDLKKNEFNISFKAEIS